jgi:hypothetical protein
MTIEVRGLVWAGTRTGQHTAMAELAAVGVELLGPVHVDGGTAWQHFRAPDGNVWEIAHHRS